MTDNLIFHTWYYCTWHTLYSTSSSWL